MFQDTLRVAKIPFDSAKVAMSCDIGQNQWVDMTYGELKEIIDEVYKIFVSIGVQKRDRILIIGENHFKWLPVFLGITGYGAVAVPVDGNVADKKLLAIIENCNPKAVIVTKKYQDRLRDLFTRNNVSCNLVNFHFDLVLEKEQTVSLAQQPSPPQPSDIAAIIYTSGTTGKPKGAMLTHRALADSVRLGITIGGIGPKDVLLTILPFTHVFGLMDAGLAPLACGAKVILGASFNPIEILQIIMKYRVTYILAVPRLAEIFAGAMRGTNIQLPGIKMFIGGASCGSETIKFLRKRGIVALQGYGMTETAGGIVACLDGPPESVGRCPKDVDVKIINPKNGVGEILISSSTLLSGIYGSPELSSDIFDGKYLKTGDVGEIDSEGYLFIRGRIKDVIVPPGGVNVYPDELELRLGTLPFAEEYTVMGMKEDQREYPALIVKPKQDFLSGKNVGNIKGYIDEEISRITRDWPEWERFRKVHLIDFSLPRSASQKVQRNRLSEILLLAFPCEKATPFDGSVPRPEEHQPLSPDLEKHLFDKFQTAVAFFLNCSKELIVREKRLTEFIQLDSLGIIALLAHLEELFEVPLKNLRSEDIRDFGALFQAMIRTEEFKDAEGKDIATGATSILPPLLDFSPEAVKQRQKFLQNKIAGSIKALPKPEDARSLAGNIEGFFGYGQIPLGLVGPLKVTGDYAVGEFYLPLATTEGALVSSVARGCQVIAMSGGARAKLLADSLVRAPIFMFSSIVDLAEFLNWVHINFENLKTAAESTTRHGKLEAIEPFPMGTNLCLRFVYATGDASGQNMTTIATHKAIEFIRVNYKGRIDDCFLESNLSGDKKINGVSFTRNRGKRVIAEVEIPGEIVEKYLHTTCERMRKLSEMSMMTALHSHSFGSQAHFANVLAAIFIAAGQNPACVAESATGVTQIEQRENNLAISVTMPGIMIGTVGGGTRLPTQQVCLQIMECDGPRKAKKMAEIMAAAVLAGEISLIAAMAADEFAISHAKYGRSSHSK